MFMKLFLLCISFFFINNISYQFINSSKILTYLSVLKCYYSLLLTFKLPFKASLLAKFSKLLSFFFQKENRRTKSVSRSLSIILLKNEYLSIKM